MDQFCVTLRKIEAEVWAKYEQKIVFVTQFESRLAATALNHVHLGVKPDIDTVASK